MYSRSHELRWSCCIIWDSEGSSAWCLRSLDVKLFCLRAHQKPIYVTVVQIRLIFNVCFCWWTLGGVWSALAGVGVFGCGLFPGKCRVMGCGVCPRHTDTGLIWFTEHCLFLALFLPASFPFSKPLSRSTRAQKPEKCRWAVKLGSRFTCRPHCGTGDHQVERLICSSRPQGKNIQQIFLDLTWQRCVINLLTLQYKVCETLFTLTCK